jgi:hypothetical protein
MRRGKFGRFLTTRLVHPQNARPRKPFLLTAKLRVTERFNNRLRLCG